MINKKQLELLKELSEVDYMEKIGVDNCNFMRFDEGVTIEIKGRNVRCVCDINKSQNIQTIFDNLEGEYKTRLKENELFIYFNKKTTQPNHIKTLFDVLIQNYNPQREGKKVRMGKKENDINIIQDKCEVCLDVPIIPGVLTSSIWCNELSNFKNEINVFYEDFISYGVNFLGLSTGLNEILTHNTKRGVC